MIYTILKSFIVGFAVSAIVGPMCIFFIKKTLELGYKASFAVGLGLVVADIVYASMALVGLKAISGFLTENANLIKITGGIFLLFLAINELRKNTPLNSTKDNNKESLKLFAKTFFLTLTNPLTIVIFISLFANIAREKNTIMESILIIISFSFGSMTWLIILALIILKIRNRLSSTWMKRMKYLSAIIIAGFGMWSILNSILHN